MCLISTDSMSRKLTVAHSTFTTSPWLKAGNMSVLSKVLLVEYPQKPKFQLKDLQAQQVLYIIRLLFSNL